MAKSANNLNAVLQDTADAIKAKKGSTTEICPRDFADEITNLPSGGGSSTYYRILGFNTSGTGVSADATCQFEDVREAFYDSNANSPVIRGFETEEEGYNDIPLTFNAYPDDHVIEIRKSSGWQPYVDAETGDADPDTLDQRLILSLTVWGSESNPSDWLTDQSILWKNPAAIIHSIGNQEPFNRITLVVGGAFNDDQIVVKVPEDSENFIPKIKIDGDFSSYGMTENDIEEWFIDYVREIIIIDLTGKVLATFDYTDIEWILPGSGSGSGAAS